MSERRMTAELVAKFLEELRREERSSRTLEKYGRDVRAFAAFLDGRAVTRDLATQWREHLLSGGYAPVTVNSMVAAVNRFFAVQGWEDCRIQSLRLQRRFFRDERRELDRDEYLRLIETARALGRERLALLMEAMCATGVRVSEVKYLTVEAAGRGRAEIRLKGKVRTILLPGKLCRRLLKYARKKDRLRRDLSHQMRERSAPKADLVGDEGPVPPGGGGAQQGVPPQPAPPVRPRLLPGEPGRGPAGRRAGPQLHRDHPHLSGHHRRRARPDSGAAPADLLDKIFLLGTVWISGNREDFPYITKYGTGSRPLRKKFSVWSIFHADFPCIFIPIEVN